MEWVGVIHGTLDRRPFKTSRNLINLLTLGPRIIDFFPQGILFAK